MVHMAIKVGRQLRKGHIRPTFNSGSSSSSKLNIRREGIVWSRSFVPSKAKPLNAKVDALTIAKDKFKNQPKHTHDVKCYKCQ